MTDYTDLIARLREDDPATWPPCDEAADALEAQARRIAELEHTSKCHVEGFIKQCEIANKQAHRIAEFEAAMKPFLMRGNLFDVLFAGYSDDKMANCEFRVGDLRAVRDALGEKE